MNVYGFFETLDSIFQYDTLQKIMSIAFSLYMTQLAGKEPSNFRQLSNLIEIRFISLT